MQENTSAACNTSPGLNEGLFFGCHAHGFAWGPPNVQGMPNQSGGHGTQDSSSIGMVDRQGNNPPHFVPAEYRPIRKRGESEC